MQFRNSKARDITRKLTDFLYHCNKKLVLRAGLALYALLMFLLVPGCNPEKKRHLDQSTVTITDAEGRIVQKPAGDIKVITMRAGAVRLMAYMGLTANIAYIEKNDLTRVVPYMMAHPELKQLPIIGVGNNYDPEVVAASQADMIISTYISKEEADQLSDKVGKPVFCLKYGDLVHFKDDFYNSLKSLGMLFNKAERADSLIQYIELNLSDISGRVQIRQPVPKVYAGGIAFNGVQGIASTRAQYPPFYYLKLHAPADSIPNSLESIGLGQKNMMVDLEQILLWDPDYIFLDASGKEQWKEEIKKPLIQKLTAFEKGHIYTLLPFNWHTINYENLLCNNWFIGKLLFPEAFHDVNVDQKCREIFQYFYGKDIYDEVKDRYHPFQKPDAGYGK